MRTSFSSQSKLIVAFGCSSWAFFISARIRSISCIRCFISPLLVAGKGCVSVAVPVLSSARISCLGTHTLAGTLLWMGCMRVRASYSFIEATVAYFMFFVITVTEINGELGEFMPEKIMDYFKYIFFIPFTIWKSDSRLVSQSRSNRGNGTGS